MSSVWTDQQWEAFAALLEEGWPGKFDDSTATSWRVLLDGVDPQTAAEGLRRLLHEGHRFRPSASEVLAAARRDPSVPTFAEAFRLIFGSRGVLKARPDRRTYVDERDRRRAEQQAMLDRAATLHPLVASFVERQGLDRLRMLELDDPEYGAVRRRDLEAEWNEHVGRSADRDVAMLAAPRGNGRLDRFDPLAALGAGAPQITEGAPS